MVKKVTKLSDEEIEEHRNENYQMMAAMSGKSVSELIGESPKRGNYGEKDCLVKQMFLKNLVEPITSRRLFETLKKQGYDAKYTTFCGLLNRYERYGYAEKKTQKKPYIFGLTELGYEHAKNPYLAREELARKRMEFVFSEIEKQLAEHPEALKNLVETITQMNIGSPIGSGGVVSNSGSQYSSNDLGSELQEKLESQIFTHDFFKNADEEKLKALADGILDNSLSDDQKKELILDVINQARNNNSIIIKQAIYNSKPVGERKYYSLLVNSINHPVTRFLYEKIPFRFIYIPNKNDLRLESEAIAGKYRNNQDGIVLRFYYINNNLFGGKFIITTQKADKQLMFYYHGKNGKKYEITTMSFSDYVKAKKKSGGIKLKINT